MFHFSFSFWSRGLSAILLPVYVLGMLKGILGLKNDFIFLTFMIISSLKLSSFKALVLEASPSRWQGTVT